MNTLLVVYSNLGVGGIPQKIVDIVNQLNKNGRYNRLYVLLRKETEFSLAPTMAHGITRVDYFQRLGFRKSPLLFFFRLMRAIHVYRPTTILAFISSYAVPVLLGKLLFFWRSTKVIVGEDHMTSVMIRTMKFPWIQKLGIRLLYSKADAILVPTDAIKQDLVKHFSIPKGKIIVIPNWTKIPLKLAGESRTIDIAYAGRFDKTKNLPLLLSAAAKIKSAHNNLRVVLLGDGPEKSILKVLVHRHGLDANVSIQPPTLHAGSYLQQTKMLFYASGDTEGMPLAMLEAMAHGCVVVSLLFKGIEEFIQHEHTGFLPRSPEEMTQVILDLLTNKHRRSAIAKNAYAYVKKHHSADNLCRQYVEKLI